MSERGFSFRVTVSGLEVSAPSGVHAPWRSHHVEVCVLASVCTVSERYLSTKESKLRGYKNKTKNLGLYRVSPSDHFY